MDSKQAAAIRLGLIVGEGMEQCLFEREVELEPSPIQIREVQTELIKLKNQIISDKVIIEGMLKVKIYFVSTDRLIYHHFEDCSFAASLTVLGAETGMEADIHCSAPHVFFDLTPEGTVKLKLIMDLYASVSKLAEVEVPVGGDKLVRVEQPYLEEKREELLEIKIPFQHLAEMINKIEDRVTKVRTSLEDDRVCLRGAINQQIYYSDQDKLERYKSWETKFEFCFELPGAKRNMSLKTDWQLEEVKREIAESGRVVERKIALTVFLKLAKPVELMIAGDGDTLVGVPVVIGEQTKQFLVEQKLSLNPPGKKVRNSKHIVLGLKEYLLKDKLVLEGEVETEIFYISCNNLEQYITHTWQFSTILNLPGTAKGMNSYAEGKVIFADFDLEDGGELLRQKSIIELFGRVTENVRMLVRTSKH